MDFRSFKKTVISICAFFLLAVITCGCGNGDTSTAKNKFSAGVCLEMHTDNQSSFLNDSVDNFVKYASGTREQSAPKVSSVTWNTYGEHTEDMFLFRISTNADMSEAKEYSSNEGKIEFTNLLVGTTYYHELINTTDNEVILKGFSTTSSECPRNLYVEGVTNVRDLGGWETSENRKVKQGLVFRSGAFNKDKAEDITITEKGIDTMLNDFKVKTEIDLRQDEIRTSSALGENVIYINIPMSGNDVYKDFKLLSEQTKQVFQIFADENSYPVVIHCSIGTDRTGLMCFLLNGLCGVPEDNLYKDYMFSNFGQIKGMRKLSEITDSYVAELNKMPGDNMKEHIRYYLKSIGLTDEQLDTIVRIMVE